jgi:hypothetical protein
MEIMLLSQGQALTYRDLTHFKKANHPHLNHSFS